MSGKRSGFTFIELVVVVVIVGLLAAASLPRFLSMDTAAHASTADGVRGALGAAVNIARSQWQALSQPPTVLLDANVIVMSSAGWPEATTGVADGVATPQKCVQVWNGILSNPPVASISPCNGNCRYLASVAVNPQVCIFIDEQGSGNNTISYNFSTGAVY